jgi:hypothetical protein
MRNLASDTSQEQEPQSTDERGFRSFFYLCVLVTVVWLLSGGVIYYVFDDWQTRGTVGDTFGAINALFSGLALAGIFYALLLQRRELKLQRLELHTTRRVMTSQLREMRASRELQSQPLCLPTLNALEIERPRFYFSLPDDQHSAQSRYRVAIGLQNPTQYPCVGITIIIHIEFDVDGAKVRLNSTDEFLECVAPYAVIGPGPTSPDFVFSGDAAGRFFDALRRPDPKQVPQISVTIHYKNITGAHFEIQQWFYVCMHQDQSDIIGSWHTSIVGFDAKHKQQVTSLKAMKAKGDPAWQGLFDQVQFSFDQSLGTNGATVSVSCHPAAASFRIRQITNQAL